MSTLEGFPSSSKPSFLTFMVSSMNSTILLTKLSSYALIYFALALNFEDSSKDEEGKLAYKSIKTINFFPYNSYLSFEIYFKEIKLFSLVFMENGYQFYFLNSLGTFSERKQFMEFNSISCAIPRNNECYFNITNYVSCMLGVEDKGRGMEKELGTILEELPINLSLNPSLMCYEVSFVKLKFFLESYFSHVSIIGDLLMWNDLQ
ncbi:hypothetical protein M9H77_17071 [Catharanthus roseus]|uniref:Uncharacterized protein n=1 Tax=Catharanthus roseus TaxID=4058 RepID=A0ACC0B3J8_CATRO|nr:hypothetical protein M9H77_17071 [Catharanthus roseus]